MPTLPVGVKALPIEQSDIDREIGDRPFSIQVNGAEVAMVHTKLGLIDSVTALASFVIDARELIGEEVAVLDQLLGETSNPPDLVEHEEGSIVEYIDYAQRR